MKNIIILAALAVTASMTFGNQISEDQQRFIKKYAQQKQKVKPADALVNTCKEPDLTAGFVDLYNGKDLTGWTSRGGHCTFKAQGEVIVATCVPGSPSTYLCTDREDYTDFIFTAEVKWIVDANSGIMFRSGHRLSSKGNEIVYGPQCELEGFAQNRGWSGGIFGQSAGGWRYPLWLDVHKAVRKTLKKDNWNRVTIEAKGNTIKTWVNGLPAAHWVNDQHTEGFFGLQNHAGNKGEVHFRNIRVKKLSTESAHTTTSSSNDYAWTDLFADGDFSNWTDLKKRPVTKGWHINNDSVHRRSKCGDIITKQHYDNFELRFDWKISDAGNSGVKYRTHGSLGLEYQVLDDAKHVDRKNPTHRAASLYELVAAPESKSLKPVGEWNHARIVANGHNIQHWLNGEKVVQIEVGSDDWKKRFQNSKYRKHKGFGNWAGPILLQDHNDDVWYRNVQIREL